MDNGSTHWIRRTLYAVLIGVSPMLLGLLLIGLARLILQRLEHAYHRRQKVIDRRSSTFLYRAGRPTLSYTPVSMTEIHRIIHGDHSSQQLTESSSSLVNTEHSALTNLVIQRDAINSTPFTALFAPMSTIETINERGHRRPSMITVQREVVETTTLTPLSPNRSKIYDYYESKGMCTDRLLPRSTTRTLTTTVIFDELKDFHSTSSIPCSLERSHSNSDDELWMSETFSLLSFLFHHTSTTYIVQI